jgi:hypothetical protein
LLGECIDASEDELVCKEAYIDGRDANRRIAKRRYNNKQQRKKC